MTDKAVRFPVIEGGGANCDVPARPGILIGNRLWRAVVPEGWPDWGADEQRR